MAFLSLTYLILEIMAFTTWVHFFDFGDVLLAYALPSLLGFILFNSVGIEMLANMQKGLQQGQMPSNRLLQRGAVLVGSIFLIIPLFFTRVIAVVLILPGLRHLGIWFFKLFIFKKIANGKFNFVRFGNGGFRAGSYKQDGFEAPQERDAEVVNVTPIEITHTKITPTEKK